MQKALIIDYKYCTGCHVCEVACRNEHGFALGQCGIKVPDARPEKTGDHWSWNYVPVPTDLCDFCDARAAQGQDAACVHHCQSLCMRYGSVEELAPFLEEKPKRVLFSVREK